MLLRIERVCNPFYTKWHMGPPKRFPVTHQARTGSQPIAQSPPNSDVRRDRIHLLSLPFRFYRRRLTKQGQRLNSRPNDASIWTEADVEPRTSMILAVNTFVCGSVWSLNPGPNSAQKSGASPTEPTERRLEDKSLIFLLLENWASLISCLISFPNTFYYSASN